jgi:hypothetical protein
MSRAVRAVGIGFALVALALALTAGVAFLRRVSLAEWLLLDWIAARGVSPAALRVTRVDARGIAIADLALGAPDAPDLAIAEITASWSLAGLRERRLDSLRVSGVELRGTQREGQLSLGALDALLAGDASADAAPALPASEIAIDAARIRISTPQGVATGTLGGSVQSAADGAIDGEFKLALDGGGLRARGALEVSGSLGAPAFHALLEAEPGLPIAGRVEVRGRIEREQGERVFDATVALRDTSFTSEIMRVSGVNGVIALRGPPLHTPKKQILSLGVVDVGVPLTEGLVEFTLRRDGTVAVALAMLHFAEGELRAKDVVLDLDAKQTAVTLQARSLDLTALLAQVDMPGIEGSGTLDGDVPLVRTGKSLVVKGADLHATEGGGKIRYKPTEETRAFAASRPNDLGLAVDAFSNFQYEILEAKLDGELQGEMKIGLHVRGANPDFQDGRPVELNLNLEARLADLVRDASAAYRVPAVVEERLRAFSEGKGK